MNHSVSILSFLNYFALGALVFVLLLQLLLAARRWRLRAMLGRWFRRTRKPVFIEVYPGKSSSTAAEP